MQYCWGIQQVKTVRKMAGSWSGWKVKAYFPRLLYASLILLWPSVEESESNDKTLHINMLNLQPDLKNHSQLPSTSFHVWITSSFHFIHVLLTQFSSVRAAVVSEAAGEAPEAHHRVKDNCRAHTRWSSWSHKLAGRPAYLFVNVSC